MGRRRVLFVGWDAAEQRYLRPWLQAGLLPHMQRLIGAGVWGSLASRPPYIPSATWTTTVTGFDADEHEILTDVEPDGRGDVRPSSSTCRRRPAAWKLLSNAGRRSVVVGFPASYPAERINGVIATDRFIEAAAETTRRWLADEQAVWPPSLAADLTPLRATAAETASEEIAAFLGAGDFPSGDLRARRLASLLAQNATTHNLATWLIEREDWDFFAVRYRFLAGVSHSFACYAPPAETNCSPGDVARFGRTLQVAYQLQDMMLGRLLELAGAEVDVIVASNFGFQRQPRAIAPPPWEGNSERWAHLPDELRHERHRIDWFRRHRPRGVLALSGPRCRAGVQLSGASLLDIAPTILRLLGFQAPRDMPGRTLDAALNDSATLVEHDVDWSPADSDRQPADEKSDPWRAQRLLDCLTAVGALAPNLESAAAIEFAVTRRLLHRGQSLYRRGCYAEALAAYEELLVRGDALFARVHIAECLLALGRLEEADRRLTEIERFAPLAAIAWAMRGEWHAAHGRLAEAAALVERAREAHPQMGQLAFQLGMLYLRMEQVEPAREQLMAALRAGVDEPALHAGLACCFATLGDERLADHHRMCAEHSSASRASRG